MKQGWSRFGGQAGVGVVVLGVIVIFFGWNGAASWDRLPSQFPYLISGGILGLALVVVGAALMTVQTSRENRARLEARLEELADAVDRLAMSGTSGNGKRPASGAGRADGRVIAGPSSFHLATCRLLEGRDNLPELTVDEARERGLRPCRVCNPLPASPARRA